VQPVALIETSSSRKALAGFFLSGLLFGFPGAILPAWGYHLRPSYLAIGNYFLTIDIGLIISVALSQFLIKRRQPSFVLVVACAIAFSSLTALSFTAPPVGEWWRIYGLFGLGLGAGTLNTGILQAISPSYRLESAGTINLAGVFFGLGSSVVAILIAGTFEVYTVASILFLVALAPGLFAIMYSRTRLEADAVTQRRSLRDVAREFTIPSAVLLSLLLFCQFGNEWAIAGWLPLFVIVRLGVSPTTGLLILAEYWVCLMFGRLIAQAILSRVKHGRILLATVIASMLGCVILALTDNLFGAISGTLLVGFGFAPIYPLVVEKIGARFPHYHPGFFNGIFSVALTGGMLAPALLGYAAEYSGIQVVMALPMIGSIVVVILVLLIWLEAKFVAPGVRR
jgi:MFS transporter, FHS family, glucose/mannose:H+ symporter